MASSSAPPDESSKESGTAPTAGETEPAHFVEAPDHTAEPELGAGTQNVDALLRRYLSLPPISILSIEPAEGDVDRKASTVPPSSRPPSVADMKSFDKTLAELEPHLEATNWETVREVLGAYETLPPQLALLYAIAQRERDVKGDADALATRSVAALLCIPEDSHAALVIAKRLLRRNPVAWQQRRAPSAKVSITIAITVTLLGALAGYLLSPGVPLFR